MENEAISVLLAHTDPLMCQALGNLLTAQHYPVYFCHTEADILPLLCQHQLSVAFLGHNIAQNGNTLALAACLKAQFPAVRFVLFTQTPSFEEAIAAMCAEIDGYLFYDDGLTAIYDCIDAVVCGTPYFSPSIKQLLDDNPDPAGPTLSPQEAKVIALVEQNRSNKEIAELLHISLFTVQDHRRNIRRKLGIKGGKNILLEYLKLPPPPPPNKTLIIK
ncbi:MAG: DNA-binding response regulator [Cytophagia bacterium]|nr:MAG: DNA-binding response regulator [Cytophagia bacterium]